RPGRGLTKAQRMRRQIADALAGAGLIETLSYPFVSEAQNKTFGSPNEETAAAQRMVKLANPISAEFGWLRTTIMPGLLETARRNVSRGFRDIAVYESGKVFLPGATIGSPEIPPLGVRPSDEVLAGLEAGIPAQPHRLAAVFTGHDSAPGPGHTPRVYDWQDPIGTALDIADVAGVDLTIRQGAHHGFHPGRVAELVVDGTVIGYAGELLPKLLEDWDLPARTAAMALDLDAVGSAATDVVESQPVAPPMSTLQAVTLVFSQQLVATVADQSLRIAASVLLAHTGISQEASAAGIAEGKYSLAFK